MVLIALAAFCSAQAADMATVTIGKSAGRSVAYESVGKTDTAGVALYFPATTMQAYKGCRITEINLQLDTKLGEDSVCVFVTKSLDGECDYQQRVTGSKKTLTVTLDTPYEIDGDSLYIGYTVVGARYLCYSKAFVDGEEWVMRKGEGWKKYEGSNTATLTATVEGDSLPEDVKLMETYMPEYSLTRKGVPYSGTFANLGAEMVTSLTFTYYVDGEATSTETVDNLTVGKRKTGSFSLSGLHLTEEGQPMVSFAITAVNGKPDGAPADNVSREQSLLVRDSFIKRNTLMEVFSTELCPNCPSAHELIDSELGKRTDVIEVGHHSGFYTDTLTVQASVDYEWFYKTGKLYAPALMFDRTSLAASLPSVYSDGVPVVSPTSATLLTLYRLMSDVPAYASVNIAKTYDAESRHLSVHVEGEQLLPWATPDSLRLFVMLTEDSLYSETQRGASAGFYHRHALRQMLSSTWGDMVDVANGYAADYSTDIPEEWNAERMRVVAFVANYNSTDNTDCRVLNTAATAIADNNSSAIREVNVDEGISLHNGTVSCGGRRFSVYDVYGRAVALSVDNARLPHGVYIIKVGKRSLVFSV